jgi:hypothetical protein
MPRLKSAVWFLTVVSPVLAEEFYFGDYGNIGGLGVDLAGNVYFAGGKITSSSNVAQLVIKMDASGKPLYTAHIGDSFWAGNQSREWEGVVVGGIAVDEMGSVYLTGTVNKAVLPVVNAAQPAYGGMGDAFVGKLQSDGTGFIYLTYLGGSGRDAGKRIAVDLEGNAYVTGSTCSADFPTANAVQTSLRGNGTGGVAGWPLPFGGCDAFVTKLDPTGSILLYSTYLGGSGDDLALAIAADSRGSAFVAGATSSGDFPTANPLQATISCGATFLCSDAFVTKLTAAGAIEYSTYLGGTGYEWANGISADAAGNAYVIGVTGSCDFPTLEAYQPGPGAHPVPYLGGDCQDAFVSKLGPDGKLISSTYLGGSGPEEGSAIALDAKGNVYTAGAANSTDFPTLNSLQEPANNTGFVTKFNATMSGLLFSTYFGPSLEERNVEAFNMALDASGNIYVAAAVSGDAWGAFVLKIDYSQTIPIRKLEHGHSTGNRPHE